MPSKFLCVGQALVLLSFLAFSSPVKAIDNDFDGDGRSDTAVWRPSNGT